MRIHYEMILHAEVQIGDTLLRQGREWVVDSIHTNDDCFLFSCHGTGPNGGRLTHEFTAYPRQEILIARVLPSHQQPRGYFPVGMTA